jgi:carbon monoxide dehydrogenase subunit G
MQLDQSFTVKANPDTVYAFLLDVNRVVGCMPGVQLIEAKGDNTFVGTLKVKVGPVSVQYRGTAQITSADPETRTATLSAEGTEGVGAGNVKGTAVMTVTPQDEGSLVEMSGDVLIAGRLAQFGRGIIEGVSKRLTNDMANCIRLQLENPDAATAGAGTANEGASVSALGLLGSVMSDKLRRRG